MYLFGYLVDYQAAKEALPFCHALIRLAVATDDERLKQFILDEMLPTLVRFDDRSPQSGISRLRSELSSSNEVSSMDDVVCLGQEIYKVYLHNQASYECISSYCVLVICCYLKGPSHICAQINTKCVVQKFSVLFS